MGWFENAKKWTEKNVTKPVSNIARATDDKLDTVVNAGGKVAQGKVSEGLGDVGQVYWETVIDLNTGGNRELVNQATGGAADKVIGGFGRGNTGDIFDTGVTALSVYYPQAAGFIDQVVNPEKYVPSQPNQMPAFNNGGLISGNPTDSNMSNNQIYMVVAAVILLILLIFLAKR